MINSSCYRINNIPCTQSTKRCYYPFTTDKNITSYVCCKNHLIELLSYIVGVLDEYEISYFLDYGTLLGCVRNNSFIPWDTLGV